MALLSRQTPFQSLRNFEDLMDEMWSGFPRRGREGDGESLRRWTPRVDIYSQNDQLVIECELPGMKKDDIQVDVEENRLTISGERRKEKEVSAEEREYYRNERQWAQFERSFTLPSSIDTEHVDAEYEDGVLRVTMPKTEDARKKRIEIK